MKGEGSQFMISADTIIFDKPDKQYYRRISDEILKYEFSINGLSDDEKVSQIDSQGFGSKIILNVDNYLNSSYQLPDSNGTIKLDVSLDVRSWPEKMKQMAPLENILATTHINECGGFYEKHTGKTLIRQIIPYEKGSQDLVFEFSGTDCPEYKFDFYDEESLKLEIFYSEKRKFQITTFERDGSKITIPKSFVGFMQVDSYFFIVASATFKNSDKTFSQELSVVLKYKWAEEIIVDLQDSYGVAFQSSLFIDASQATIINADSHEDHVDKYSITYHWFCPEIYDCSGIEKNQPTFSISSFQSRQIDVDYLKSSQFVLQIKSGYAMQNNMAYYEKVFNVTWIGPPRDVKVNFKEKNPISQFLELDLSLRNENGEDQYWFNSVSIEWSIEGISQDARIVADQINQTTDFINGNSSYIFIVDKFVLSVEGSYRVFMRLYATEFENIQVYEDVIIIKMISGPQGGNIAMLDRDYNGNALQYNFTISAVGWTGEEFENGFLKYQYFYRDEAGNMVALTEQAYDLTEIQTLLPPTLLIQVRVTDAYNGTTTADLAVGIEIEQTEQDYDIFLDQTGLLQGQISQSIALNDSQGALNSFKSLAIWTSSIQTMSLGSTVSEIQTMQCSVLNLLNDNMHFINASEPEAQEFMIQSALIQMRQVMDLQEEAIKGECVGKMMDVFQRVLSNQQVMEDQIQRGEFEVASGVNMFSQIYADLNSQYEEEENQDFGENSDQLRASIAEFETIVGKAMLQGQRFTEKTDNLQMTFQKYSRTSENQASFTFRSDDGSVEGIFPLESAIPPSDSYTMSSMIFSAYLDEELNETSKNGPFVGKSSSYQKIMSNNTIYLAFRDSDGNYINADSAFGQEEGQDDPKIELNFRVDVTESIKQIFLARNQSTLRCAYSGILDSDFDQFGTEQCSTQLLDQNLGIIKPISDEPQEPDDPLEIDEPGESDESTSKTISPSDPELETPSLVQFSEEYVQIQDSEYITVKCLCSHMSYYLIVEDNTPPVIEAQDPQNNDFQFEDIDTIFDEELDESNSQFSWVMVLLVLYVLFVSVIAILYARARDIQDYSMLTQTDEGIEDIPVVQDHNGGKLKQKSQQSLKRISLITWIFHRKVQIEPYCFQLTKGKSISKQIELSTWVVFKMFMSQLHPLMSIANRFDLTLKRIDRVIPLVLRVVIIIPICFYSLKDIKFEKLMEGNDDAKNDLIKVLVSCTISSLFLLPMPSFMFSSCRTKFQLQHQLLSLQDQDNTNILESQDQEQTSRPLTGKKKDSLEINSSWSIKSLMLIQITPFSELLANPSLILKSQDEFEKKMIEKSESINNTFSNKQENSGSQNLQSHPQSQALIKMQSLENAKQNSSENIGILTQSADISVDENADKTEARILGPLDESAQKDQDDKIQSNIFVRESFNQSNLGHSLKKQQKLRKEANKLILEVNEDKEDEQVMNVQRSVSPDMQRVQHSQSQDSQIFKFGKEKSPIIQNLVQVSDERPVTQLFDDDNDEVLAGSVLSENVNQSSKKISQDRDALNSENAQSQMVQSKQAKDILNSENAQSTSRVPVVQQVDNQFEGGDRKENDNISVLTKKSRFGDFDDLTVHNEIVQSIDIDSSQNLGLNAIRRPSIAARKQPSRYQSNQYESGSSVNSQKPPISHESPKRFASLGQNQKQRNINTFSGLSPSNGVKSGVQIQNYQSSKQVVNHLRTLEEDVIKENQDEISEANGVNQGIIDLEQVQMQLDFNQDGVMVLDDGTIIVQDEGQNNQENLDNLYQDEFGNIVQIEDIDPDLIVNPNFDPDFSNGPKQTFVDEKKQLVLESNLTGQLIVRAIQILVIGVVMVTWLVSYSLSAEFYDKESAQLFVICYFSVQFFSFFVLTPILLMLHAIMFTCGCYQTLLCGFQSQIFPLSQMLVTDLKEQSQQMIQIKRRDNKVLLRDHTE